MMRDMKVSSDGKSAAVPKSELDKYLDPNAEDEADEEDEDEGEVIDKSARTDYFELPSRRRGTGPGGATEGPDGSLWPAP